MKLLGTLPMKVCYQKQAPKELYLFVVTGDGPCLLGRSWMKHISLNLETIGAV